MEMLLLCLGAAVFLVLASFVATGVIYIVYHVVSWFCRKCFQ